MQTILILGGGKSSAFLIDYLADTCIRKERRLILADLDLDTCTQKLRNKFGTEARILDLENELDRKNLISEANLVISMLPAFLHPLIAKDCLELHKHFFTASYQSDELLEMRSEISQKGLLFLNECGLDPGLDHMSAMQIIDEAKARGEEIISFKSYCGGLLAPESEDNPWKYKFTWNPRNVVLAGQATSRYIDRGELKFVPYHQLFKRLETIHFPDLGDFDGYPNRDSLSYRSIYGLEKIPTMLRGTLRRAGYCKAWNVFVQLGMCDDSFQLELPISSTLKDFLNSFLPSNSALTAEEKLADLMHDLDFETWEKISWLGFFGTRKLPLSSGSPAQILQSILEEDWKLQPEDRDMIVMQHIFEIKTSTGIKEIRSSLVSFGKDSTYTAMAKTVGLPLAIAVDLFLDGKIKETGLQLPVSKEIYEPILHQLVSHGIKFIEHEKTRP
jgi:saccharopine dehydrogenase-like NADP-dependent oxidoreductase